MENKSHAFMAGLFTLLLGFAVLAALYWLGGKKEATKDYVVVTRQNVTGLNPQAQVRYRGIRVGKVNDIRLDADDPGNILISIQVDEAVPVTSRTVAKLAYQGITGLAHILLEEAGKQVVAPTLVEDGEIRRIAMAPSLLDELGEAGPVLIKQAKDLSNSLNALINEKNREKIAAILVNLEGGTRQMQPALENLNGTLVQVKTLLNDDNVKKLSVAAGEAGPLLAETRTLIQRLQGTAEKLDLAVGDPAASGASALMPRISDMVNDLSQTSRQLNRVLKQVEESPQSLVFGAPPLPPGPGEPGFVAPAAR